MNTVDKLLESVKEIWSSYDNHPFVSAIRDGTLDRGKFRHYLIQDFLYLEEYAKILAVGVAKAKSVETANLFANHIKVMNGEPDIHNEYKWRLDITDEELKSAKRSFDNLSYTSYMLRVAYEESECEILTAILVHAYSYEVIAKNIIRSNSDSINDPFYGEWITGYASYGYSGDNAVLLDTLNRLTENYTEAQTEHLKDIFGVCSKYESAFWEMSWNLGEQ